MRYRVNQRDELAYTSLIEGIKNLELYELGVNGEPIVENVNYNQALKYIREKVVKPLYGKK